jgi:hypothetical protein
MLYQTIDDPKKRNTVYGLYNMTGTFAMSGGVLLSGLPQILAQQYDRIKLSLKFLFVHYSVIGLGVLWIYFLISNRVEVSRNHLNKLYRQSQEKLLVNYQAFLLSIHLQKDLSFKA